MANGGLDRLIGLTYDLVVASDEALAWLKSGTDIIEDEDQSDEDEVAEAREVQRDLKGSLRPFVGFDHDREEHEESGDRRHA